MFGEEVEELRGIRWDWGQFESTRGFPVSSNLLDWVVGQEQALEECNLVLDEWIHKLKWIRSEGAFDGWRDPGSKRPQSKTVPPGPFLLLLGDPGTGKSLIGRALAAHLTGKYEEEGFKSQDVLCWPNEVNPSAPRISIHEAGEGKALVSREKPKGEEMRTAYNVAFKAAFWMILVIGFSFLGLGLSDLLKNYLAWRSLDGLAAGTSGGVVTSSFASISDKIVKGGFLLFMAFILSVYVERRQGAQARGIGGAIRSTAPKLLIDNSQGAAPFVDATGHSSVQLFGSIAWDPYQTGRLGTPEHQRVTAGDVHRANLGILYIDEVKNLQPFEATTLLTVLEDGQLPIAHRAMHDGGGTSALAVSTDPIPSLTLLVAAGNFDAVDRIHPALMDRICGYGRVIRMNNDMLNTVENRRKYVQFIAQEVKRFRLPSFSRGACEEIVNEGRRRSDKRNSIITKFRPLIGVIKTAGQLALNQGLEFVEASHVREAVAEHCKTIQQQILVHQIEERGSLLEIEPRGTSFGSIYGLAAVSDSFSGERTGTILKVTAYMHRKSPDDSTRGFYKVTGIARDGRWIDDSIDKVRTVILKRYNVDIAQHYYTHIDFSQSQGVDGPSAGVTMTLLICSLISGRRARTLARTGRPMRQDVAVTGEINVGSDDEVRVTAVSGLYEKIKAAEAWGFRKVLIPQRNLEHSVNPDDFEIEVVGCSTLDDYLRHILVDDEDPFASDDRDETSGERKVSAPWEALGSPSSLTVLPPPLTVGLTFEQENGSKRRDETQIEAD
ncbi:AAA family ATPase [Candidatus Bathyarchaeota archaeon]|nr:AAA family ATPase [Candidatus Bathyarchaeota archaeon]